MALVAVVAGVMAVVVPWFRDPSTPPAAAPTRPNKILMEGVDTNSNGRGPLGPDRPSFSDDRSWREPSLLPPDLRSGERP
jgi:hypothetical protein